MISRKALLSVLLVFTYLLGLAHEIIPHSHHNAPGSLAALSIESGHPNHQDCLHFESPANLSSHSETSSCSSHHHHPPLCNQRTLYLPSLAHNLSSSDESFDLAFYPLLAEILRIRIIPEKPVFPADHAVFISARGPDNLSLRGPPEFSF
jgi:hypothetical protein